MTANCIFQAERLQERERREYQRRREELGQDHLRLALDQVHLGLITVTLRYCVVLCAVLCSFFALARISVRCSIRYQKNRWNNDGSFPKCPSKP